MTIQQLAPEVVSKIAAGEVIERPASVVKELVENGLDAGARHITVHVEGGGKELIRVTDDGTGIAPSQLELAVQRHTTSKLASAQDLARVVTLGFRGEALASVAAVAEMTLTSITGHEQPGRRVVVRNERIIDSVRVGGSVGTQIMVRGLFRSLPARLAFLKADRTELGHIVRLVTHAAIGYPEVAFTLLDDATERLRTPGDGNLRNALLSVYGRELVEQLIEFPPGEVLGIDGFASQPHVHRPSRDFISLFVNRRWVSDRLLAGAISEAYQSLIPSRRFPIVVLKLTLPPGEVDVNVHPTKAEVRFRRGGDIFGGVSGTIRGALASTGKVLPLQLRQPVVDQFFLPTKPPGALGWQHHSQALPRRIRPGKYSGETDPASEDSKPTALQSPVLRPLGQIDSTYVIASGPQGLYLIDQHAAHERVLYEDLEHGNKLGVQPLLEPISVELSAGESEWVTEHLDTLRAYGLELEPFGANAWLVRAVPTTKTPLSGSTYLQEVVAEAQTPEFRRLEAHERVRWGLACKAAVKAGETLSLDEMQALLERLQNCDMSLSCPHGRPTILLLSRDLLDRQFGRT